ncbi:hypothetical protein DAPPUDRAFT_250199 [Daphnia pulex]|uniref:Uncharacterized protein n=1 Tax=Daphnia pulex TaxID=6669 RepID=E9GY38_DAPPU|nr:hypothetical protein DAPPUDRAFT_250199 [Daphnia pulex]|eukprot:EFX75533.1 hypothetical protein DAPPUDRAFT_250199 [Daphnia pulex]
MSFPPLMAHPSNIPFPWIPAPTESVPQPELPSTLQDSRCSNCPLMLKKISQLEKKLTCLEKEQDQICKRLNQGQTKCAELRQSPSVQWAKENFAIEKNGQREKQQKGISVRPSAAFPKENHPLTPAEVEQLRIWFPDGIIPKEAIPLMARMTEENSTNDVIEPERNPLVKPVVKEEIINPYRMTPRQGTDWTERQMFPYNSAQSFLAEEKKVKEQQKSQPPNDGWSTQLFKWFRSSAEQLFFDKDKEIIWNKKKRMWVDTSTGMRVTNQEARAYFAETWPTHMD